MVILIGNKIDLETRVVSREKALEFAQTHRFSYYETSALWPRQALMDKDNPFLISYFLIKTSRKLIFFLKMSNQKSQFSQIFKNLVSKEEPKIEKDKPLKVELPTIYRRTDCDC